MRNDCILNVTEKSRLEKLLTYEDQWPLLSFRKSIQKVRIYINIFAYNVIKNKIFENFTIGVILANSITLCMEDPLAVGTTTTQTVIEYIFLALYSIEMILKILGLGFLFNKGAYLRDPWNILDFVIVMSAYLTLGQNLAEMIQNGGTMPIETAVNQKSGGLSLNSLRAFRVLRPLRAVTSIKGLQVLVLSVLTSLPLLQDTIIVLLSFFVVFAIAGTQLLSGLLKKRCVNIETGIMMDDGGDQDGAMCGGRAVCPDGYFCGKQNENPNYGVTNFDNLLYSLLVVFQCITLEGWSDIMIEYQMTFSDASFILFLMIVFIGAFFLVNLLLAVINSSFSTTHNDQQKQMAALKEKNRLKKKIGPDDMNFDESEPINEIGITQYWIAKRVAQRMISQLRKVQAKKLAEEIERKNRPPSEQDEDFKAVVICLPEPFIPVEEVSKRDQKQESEADDDFEEKFQKLLEKGIETTRPIQPSKEIKRFAVNDMRTANRLQKDLFQNNKKEILTGDKDNLAVKHDRDKKAANLNASGSNLDDLVNIEQFLINAQRLDSKQSSNGEHPFDLSFVHSQIADYPDYSSDEQPQAIRRVDRSQDDDQSAIASDSSFNSKLKAIALDDDSSERQLESQPQSRQFRVNRQKTFQTNITKEVDQTHGSTQINGSVNKHDDGMSIFSLDENPKFRKKSKKGKKGKKAKAGKTQNNDGLGGKEKFQAFKQLFRQDQQEFLEEKRAKNPYEYINKKQYKISINKNMPYRSTSMEEVFQIRNQVNEALFVQESNLFIKAKLPKSITEVDEELPEIEEQSMKPIYDAYQLKTKYQISQHEEVEFSDDDDDALILALQPFDTVMSVGYGHLLTHKPIKFVSRRSDIIVSSTLSITITPADSEYRPLDIGLLTPEEASQWCHKRHQYRGMNVKCADLDFYDNQVFDQPADLMAARVSSNGSQVGSKLRSIATLNKNGSAPFDQSQAPQSELKFNNQTLQKAKLIPKTLLTKPLPPEKLNLLTDEEKRLYNIQKGKYDTYMRVLEKKKVTGDLPTQRVFKLSEVDQLMSGLHHDEENQDEEDEVDLSQMKYLSRSDTFKQQKLADFEAEARSIIKAIPKKPKYTGEYVPQELRDEFDYPATLMEHDVNFTQVLMKDMSRKRKTPLWSGQEVLDIGLNNELSEWVISRINAVRVWPKGLMGTLKKARCLLKMVVKHEMFNSFMTFCVLLNTIVMGMDSYDMSEALINFTEEANSVFTWIFIAEMSMKILAVGPKKYLADKMNWLDGSVVSLSIIELLMAAAGGGGGNSNAFRAIRVLRTFRVVRVARLLRALKSMKVIFEVIAKSAESFVYITLLMFVFIFIFTLLGMQIFGGQFDFPDGKPRGNYDSFIIAYLTVFQVLTTENWNSVLFDSMRSPSVGYYAPTAYYICWICIGNYILLNLFLAILLDGFLSEDDEEEGDLEEIERLKRIERNAKIEKEKSRRMKKMGNGFMTKSKQNLELQRENQTQSHGQQQEQEDVDDVDDIDELMIREIFMDEGLIKKKDLEREKRLLYFGVECEKSFYIFTKKNPIRLYAYKLYKHKLFDQTIMFLIALSSFKLAFDSYLIGYDEDSIQVVISQDIDLFLNISFLFEMITKLIALGLVMDKGSYLRDSWNCMDCFIVFTSMLDMVLTNVNLPVIKILRLLRTLRPLRVISHNIAMKLIVNSLFESVGALANVVVVILAVWLMFAIFAINIFAGKFFYCSIQPYNLRTKYECNLQGGSWVRYVQNFDDIFQAMLTLFNVAAIEGWPDVMIASLDTSDVDEGPILENSVYNGFFFVVFILIGSFFLMNFFIGVLFLKYNQAAARETIGYTQENITWIAIQKMIISQRCEHATMNKPNPHVHPRRYKAWKIVNSMPFDLGIMAVIILNIIQMGISFENEPPMYTYLLDLSNYFFTAIFLIEMLLKLQAYSWRYFETSWNKFDCLIVLSSLVDIILTWTSSSKNSALSVGPQIARIMRVLRVTRIIKLAGKNEGLQALMSTITLSVGALANVFLLLILVLFIFSVLGVFFFSGITSGDILSEYRNFSNWGQAFLFMFVLSTGESWNIVMYDCMNTPPTCIQGETCGTSYAPVYYIIFVLLVQNVMLNLFILVIISQFETYYMSEDNPIKKFSRNLEIFMKTWIQFTVAKYRCIKLREKQLNDFFKALPMPFGLPPETTPDQMKKIMLKMGIRCDDGYVYFNELLYRCMRRQYGSFKLNKKMQIIELKTQYKIYNITLQQQALSSKQEVYEQFFNKMVGQGKSSNPFLLQMYFHISFNTWLNYSRLMAKRERHYIKQEKLRAKCIQENKAFIPTEFQQDEQKLIQVSIEVDEECYYTSEEDNEVDQAAELQSNNQLMNKMITRMRTLTRKTDSVHKNSQISLQQKLSNHQLNKIHSSEQQ